MENNEDYMVNIVDSNGNPGVVEVLDIFEVDGYGVTMADMSEELKNLISHRI